MNIETAMELYQLKNFELVRYQTYCYIVLLFCCSCACQQNSSCACQHPTCRSGYELCVPANNVLPAASLSCCCANGWIPNP